MANRRVTTNSTSVAELIGLFIHQLQMCNLRQDELCLIVTDTAFNPVYADACLGAALEIGCETFQVTLPYSKNIPKKSIGAAMLEADLMVYMTTHTLHYSQEMDRMLQSGKRALMAVQPLHTLMRLKGNAEVKRRSIAGARYLSQADQIRITSSAGTDLTMYRKNRPVLANYGLADEPGKLDFWGGGMVQTAPMENTLEGTMVLNVGDQIFHFAKYIEAPVTITFKQGTITNIEGGIDAFLLQKYLEDHHHENVWKAGHIAWGTDKRAQWISQAIQYPEPGSSAGDAESYYGNVQIELGSNNDVAFKGLQIAPSHLGLCMLGCNIFLDGKQILENGEFIPDELR